MESPLVYGEEMAAHLLDAAAENVQSFENHSCPGAGEDVGLLFRGHGVPSPFGFPQDDSRLPLGKQQVLA